LQAGRRIQHSTHLHVRPGGFTIQVMGDFLMPLAEPHPDWQEFLLSAITQYVPARPRLVEYLIDPHLARPLVTGLLGRQWVSPEPGDRAGQTAYWANLGELWYRLGYDCIRVEVDCHLPYGMEKQPARPDHMVGVERCALPTGTGPISNWEDLSNYPWPTVMEPDLFAIEHLARTLPEGMGIMAGLEGGVFDHLVGVMGFDGLCLRLYDQPGLVEAVAERVGDVMAGYFDRLLAIDRVRALFVGDELGHAGGAFLSPEHMRQYVLPWHARFAAQAHEAGRPYFMHAYGPLEAIVPDLLEKVGIDAKHGFDEQHSPVEPFKLQWGHRVGVLGGLCPYKLETLTGRELRRYVRRTIERCQPGGGFAVGCGGTINGRIPIESYLTVVDEVLRMGQ
jgi:uroporphyrinogen decarboxylase